MKKKLNMLLKGSVPGRLLNQFSMDENEDRFRVATTTETILNMKEQFVQMQYMF